MEDNNNLEKKMECSVVVRVKTWFESFEMRMWMSCLMLLLAIVSAVLPGFVILAYAQNLLLETPTDASLLLWTIYAFKAVMVCIATVGATLCYADVAFPAVMAAFVLILNHTCLPDSVHDHHTLDISGSGNISGLSAKSTTED